MIKPFNPFIDFVIFYKLVKCIHYRTRQKRLHTPYSIVYNWSRFPALSTITRHSSNSISFTGNTHRKLKHYKTIYRSGDQVGGGQEEEERGGGLCWSARSTTWQQTHTALRRKNTTCRDFSLILLGRQWENKSIDINNFECIFISTFLFLMVTYHIIFIP